MDSLENAHRLRRTGRFSEALLALGESTPHSNARVAVQLLRAELLEGLGQYRQAMAIVTPLLKSARLPPLDKSTCEYILGRALLEEGDTAGGIHHLQRSASHAQNAKAFERAFAAQSKLMVVMLEQSGPGAAAALLTEVRQLAIRLGDPQVTAKMHLLVAEMEAKRGLLENARRHCTIARRILASSPNVYLEASCTNLCLAISVLLSQFDDGRSYGVRAAELAEQSGVAKTRRAILANMGTLSYELGDFNSATGYFESALVVPPTQGPVASAILDGLARVHLIQDRADSCLADLDQIESSIQTEQDRLSYEHRYAALTRVHLLAWQGHIDEALAKTDMVLDLAARAGDGLLHKQVQLTKAELLQRAGQIPSAMTLIAEIVPDLVGVSPELYGHSEQILACALASTGDPAGQAHHDRARRIYHAIGSVPRQRQLAAHWDQAREAARSVDAPTPEPPDVRGARQALHGIATAFTHASRPDLFAAELLEILNAANCTLSARAIVQSAGATVAADDDERRLSVGFKGDREIQLFIRPKPDIESVASVSAVALLLDSLHEVQRGRAEREERATLWPIEELPVEDERSVISGRMRELMSYARRIARTKVNVLITGESGTGKEILARAIHDFSDRAGKAFVPFNCTTIPRDLLESQLFGHRRGAFTGADRDYVGLIRTAREGTLFLDEVGELGLDLQPKLLRFLESGEISPLGEPGSITIDVRIVAATNTHLEDAVRAGRFREDLYYRLNVIRLSIPPLRERRDEIPAFVNHFVARAADEFKKGQLRVADETMERLLLYRWPGNVRQLQNEVRRMVALAEPDSTLLPHAISDEIFGALPIFRHAPGNGQDVAVGHDTLIPTLAHVEREMIKTALRAHHGKVDAVAHALGISRKGLYLKRQRLGL